MSASSCPRVQGTESDLQVRDKTSITVLGPISQPCTHALCKVPIVAQGKDLIELSIAGIDYYGLPSEFWSSLRKPT